MANLDFPKPPAVRELWVVEFERHPGDPGVSVIVLADCGVRAMLEACRLCPQYRGLNDGTFAYLMDFAEFDWVSGELIVMKRKKGTVAPVVAIDHPVTRRTNSRRGEGAQESDSR